MLKRSTKYLALIILNAWILAMLVILWTHDVLLAIDHSIRIVELLKILILSVLLAVIFRFLFKHKSHWSKGKKLGLACLIILVMSGYFYVDYFGRINNDLTTEVKEALKDKLRPNVDAPHGFRAEGLSFEQYEALRTLGGLKEISHKASRISVNYAYDGFFPDYNLTIQYRVPKTSNIKSESFENDRAAFVQMVKNNRDYKSVVYHELRW